MYGNKDPIGFFTTECLVTKNQKNFSAQNICQQRTNWILFIRKTPIEFFDAEHSVAKNGWNSLLPKFQYQTINITIYYQMFGNKDLIGFFTTTSSVAKN